MYYTVCKWTKFSGYAHSEMYSCRVYRVIVKTSDDYALRRQDKKRQRKLILRATLAGYGGLYAVTLYRVQYNHNHNNHLIHTRRSYKHKINNSEHVVW